MSDEQRLEQVTQDFHSSCDNNQSSTANDRIDEMRDIITNSWCEPQTSQYEAGNDSTK
jgi:hypothetical protein